MKQIATKQERHIGRQLPLDNENDSYKRENMYE